MAKRKTATLIPYDYYVWGKTKRVWVDKEDASPDPSGLLLWGYDDCGRSIKGDFKRQFTKAGKPIKIEYDISDTRTAMQEKSRKIEAIKNSIRHMGRCITE